MWSLESHCPDRIESQCADARLGHLMSRATATILCGLTVLVVAVVPAFADDVWYRYEGDVLPHDVAAGWTVYDPCDGVCYESLEVGRYRTDFFGGGNGSYNLHFRVTSVDDDPPPTFWVEWRHRSNQLLPPTSSTCNAHFVVAHNTIFESVYCFSDAVFTHGGDGVTGLTTDEFHTYRYESPDAAAYWFSVDGFVFTQSVGYKGPFGVYLQFGNVGGCFGATFPVTNEFDFVRFGTIAYGERVIATDPPSGFVDASIHPTLDRFAVTFDEANYVYIDEVSVGVTGGIAPVVTQTRRRESDEPDTVEIVLDRPIPHGESTRFTFFDGVATNIVEYTYAPGDTDGDGSVTLADVAAFQNCLGAESLIGACLALDLDHSHALDLADFAIFHALLLDAD